MDKQTMLKAYYKAQITNLIESANDISLLDLIYRLLVEENKKTNQGGKSND